MRSGLVSVTFRKLSPKEIVDLCAEARVEGIEWGGDVHVPPGDAKNAREVARMTREAGLTVSSYGSYYRCDEEFGPVLETALELRAPVIRVWAGRKGSAATAPEERAAIVDAAASATRMCVEAGVDLAFEYHANTLTDDFDSTCRLLEEVPGSLTYFQPPNALTREECVDALTALALKVPALHVFSWKGGKRMALDEGEALWKALLPKATRAKWALLEFVLGDDPQQFLKDAATLRGWLG